MTSEVPGSRPLISVAHITGLSYAGLHDLSVRFAEHTGTTLADPRLRALVLSALSQGFTGGLYYALTGKMPTP